MRQYCHHLAGLLPIGLKVWNLISFLFFGFTVQHAPPLKCELGTMFFFVVGQIKVVTIQQLTQQDGGVGLVGLEAP